jgi:hypothetical protein
MVERVGEQRVGRAAIDEIRRVFAGRLARLSRVV